MTIRLAVLLFLGILAIPFAVFLRSAFADSGCESVAVANRVIAKARDQGTEATELAERFRPLVTSGEFTYHEYAIFLGWVIEVYSSRGTPDEIYLEKKMSCLKSLGKTEA